MSASSLMKKVSSAIAGVAFFAMGTVSAAPANAITFKFQGNFFGVIPVESSYTLDDAIFDEVINSPTNGFAENALLDFSLFVRGNVPDSSGVHSSELTSWGDRFSLQVRTNQTVEYGGLYSPYAYLLSLSVHAPDGKPLSACKVMECQGSALVGGKGGISGDILNVPVKSVPEPSVAIALGLTSTFMLMRKRKRA
ncbi:MAG TPA: PEP-CTERM sorting domain-containing protein [Leptolyngbyaceae cyanobacterium]